MEPLPNKNDLMAVLMKILPPLALSVMAKIASEYKKGKRISFLSNIIIVCLAACGAIAGYWLTKYLGWIEYKMTLTIFFCGLFSDKFFEFIFSKTFINSLFNYLEDAVKENLLMIVKKLGNKKPQ